MTSKIWNIIWSSLWNTREKNGKIFSSYTENTLHCSDVYNLAQKLDNSIQIVKITGHAWRRKVVLGRRVIPSTAFTTLAPGLPFLLVNNKIVLNKILRNPSFPNLCKEIMHHSMLRLQGWHHLVPMKSSNWRNTLYVATYSMSFPSLKQFLIYLMYDQEILCDMFFGFRQVRAKILSNSWLYAKPVNSNYFSQIFLHISKNRRLLGKIKNTLSLRFISLSLFVENYPRVFQHCWELLFLIARLLRS